MPGESLSFIQKVARFFLSKKKFDALKLESKQWFLKCEHCGHESEKSAWEIGGIRYKAGAHRHVKVFCTKCQVRRWAKFVKKP